MGRHSRRHSSSRSRSRSRSRDSRRHHSRNRSYDRSRHRHHRSYSRDRSDSYDRHSSRKDHSESRYHRSHGHHSRDRSVSKSQSHKDDGKKDVQNKEVTPKQEIKAPVPKEDVSTNSSEFLLPVKTSAGPKRVFRFDERGREINEFGEVIDTPIIKPLATLSINKKQQQKNQINPYHCQFCLISRYLSTFTPGKGAKEVPKIKNRRIVDSRIKIANREIRRHKALNFVKEGSIVKFAEEVRKKAARAQVSQSTLAQTQTQTQTQDKPEETGKVESTPIQDPSALPPPNHYPVPDMEWWDYDFLPAEICQEVKDNHYMGELHYDMLSLDHCITKE